jgi:outer membrane protein, multidrug efflux system
MIRAILVAGFLVLSVPAQASDPTPISLEEVTKKVSEQNYLLIENAFRVYQAKESIQVARGNLLPRLNLWRVASVVFDPTAALGLIEDIAPFLVPGNWFRLDEQRIIYEAQKEGYRALWANEVMTARVLYLQTLSDLSLLAHVETQYQELQALHMIVRNREILGGARPGSARDIEIRLLGLQEDRRGLEVLIGSEKAALARLLGLPGNTELSLKAAALPDLSQLPILSYDAFEARAVDVSPEVREYNHLVQACDRVRREIVFSFLGVSSASRGVAGGVFDSIPMQSGLGFGTGASMRVARAQKEILKLQAKGVTETIKRQLKLLIDGYLLDREHYVNAERRVSLTRAALADLHERIRLGDHVEILALIEASKNQIQADTSFFGVQYRALMSQEKLSRLLFEGDYAQAPTDLERLRVR